MYAVGTQKYHLNEMVLLSTQNIRNKILTFLLSICFYPHQWINLNLKIFDKARTTYEPYILEINTLSRLGSIRVLIGLCRYAGRSAPFVHMRHTYVKKFSGGMAATVNIQYASHF